MWSPTVNHCLSLPGLCSPPPLPLCTACPTTAVSSEGQRPLLFTEHRALLSSQPNETPLRSGAAEGAGGKWGSPAAFDPELTLPPGPMRRQAAGPGRASGLPQAAPGGWSGRSRGQRPLSNWPRRPSRRCPWPRGSPPQPAPAASTASRPTGGRRAAPRRRVSPGGGRRAGGSDGGGEAEEGQEARAKRPQAPGGAQERGHNRRARRTRRNT